MCYYSKGVFFTLYIITGGTMNYSEDKTLNGKIYLTLLRSGAAALYERIKTVNELNVFPIPDGDTGDNMYHTFYGGVKAVGSDLDGEIGIGKIAAAVSDGMLLNARGNSGVILSQLFFGIANGLKPFDTATVADLANAFREGVKTAYHAVVKPVEGTILTVARESFDYALERVTDDSNLSSFFGDILTRMKTSLEHTPELLPVLKEAGVIDSGGAGLYYIADGMLKAINGAPVYSEENEVASGKDLDFSLFTKDSVMTYGYCTEFLLQLQTAKTDTDAFDVQTIIDYLNTIGDSIVAFKTGSVIKVHVHTLTPQKALDFCQKFGEFLTIKIENMTLQHNETLKEKEREEVAFTVAEKPRKKYGVVAVASGKGLVDMLRELGADEIVDGGQTNNPSSEDLITAFGKVNADCIFVFPNNGNIILTAKQAANMYNGSEIIVIETKNIGDCYAALSMADFSSDNPYDVENILRENMQGVTTGMITTSIRDASLNGVDIKKDDYIGFTDKTMLASSPDKLTAFKLLCEKLGIENNPFFIVVYGKSVTEDEKSRVKEYTGGFPNSEFYEIQGDQEVYDFILIFQQ